ncbi:MAG: heme exporter protein CcmD [Methylocystis sp.]|nr:heme exporter protein CcmD [Methylocystis sp.]
MNAAHWSYIALAYGVTTLVVVAVALHIVLDYRRLRAELARLEARAANQPSAAP